MFSLKGRAVEKNLLRILFDAENETQNSLVREFSMQVHHEQFLLSANGFFSINLNLLGSVSTHDIDC